MRGRFIPAYTGNSGGSTAASCSATVHPRVHGELDRPGHGARARAGSSPRTRGTRLEPGVEPVELRFIPAYTGNSVSRPSRTHRTPVHPRVHGELGAILLSDDLPLGSSPRTRGTPAEEALGRGVGRFIPAYTGNSSFCARTIVARAVHPRVHGELAQITTAADLLSGSSPRTRGTLHANGREYERRRFIPAYTGNSCRAWSYTTPRPVHPRVHGELVSSSLSSR